MTSSYPDKTEIAELMYLSTLIYKCREKVTNNIKIKDIATSTEFMPSAASSLGLNGEVVFSHTNTRDLQAGITVNHNRKWITLVFRGSESWLDFYHDFIILQKTLHDKVKVHYGMYKQLSCDFSYNVLRREIRRLLNTYPNYTLNITGHSLGGGLALLFAYKYSLENHVQPIRCVSFASPKVGNKAFLEAFKKKNIRHIRCFTEKDIVPVLPLRGYYHVGEQMKLLQNTIEYTVEPKKPTPGLFSSCWSIKEHSCDVYNNRLHEFNYKDSPLLQKIEEEGSDKGSNKVSDKGSGEGSGEGSDKGCDKVSDKGSGQVSDKVSDKGSGQVSDKPPIETSV